MLTSEELDQVCDVLIEYEGLVPWLYCDTRGFVTVGVGDKVGTQSVLTMPFVHLSDARPAESEEKIAAYHKTQDFFHKGFTASAYAAVSDLRLPVDFCRRRLAYRVKSEFVPIVEGWLPQFEAFPIEAKFAIVDIAYNVGTVGFTAFKSLIAACNAGDFAQAALQVHTAKEGEDSARPETWGKRNRWRYEMMLLAHSAQNTIT